MDKDNATPVSVLGLGLMGAALARAFLNAGHPTTVWNRSAGKADALAAEGAVRAATVAEAIDASDLIIVCVLDYPVVRALLEPVAGGLDGKTVVNLTSGTPDQARRMSTWAIEQGADYLDGGIMAIPQMIAQPEALILYSGSRRAYTDHESVLGVLATGRYVGTDAGRAALFDLAMLTAMYGQIAGYLQGVALVDAEGVTAAEITPLIVSWLNAMAATLPHDAEQIDRREYTTDVSSLDLNKAGLATLVQAYEDQGLPTDVLKPIQSLIERRVAAGHGTDSLAGLIELLRK
ncbi:NAD(P)-dependent oxidoreductase [Thermomonospora cellulosilytica]|uniref:3-hydroxyisobutyrate dehydrogenase-like beta-hydroxyacid dehydrogenase n=1 Tax=Thermomonospora cellulosilytica TaxID=1411118 RepID=A0A7W3N025_9ACTN|nr:NAD(P)-binding domain-containing protein [Thermomonospora cellulosilytica]MBA9005061.1 3-hydroxyisobutyrate dehydrogenase-like beta-hydroxyacid dehydrogenase [Thermomonospora cellulosilytica]